MQPLVFLANHGNISAYPMGCVSVQL